jgi:hypothetical protein
LDVMPCPSTPVPVTIVAQHGPDQVGVVSSIGTGLRKPLSVKPQMTGVSSGLSRSNRTPSTPMTSTWRRVVPERSTMTSSPESQHLDNRHRNTLRQIFQHPVSHNIEWHSVTSLLDAIGSVDVHHDGQVAVRVGSESAFFTHPEGKDVDEQMVLDLRRLLTKAGYEPS